MSDYKRKNMVEYIIKNYKGIRKVRVSCDFTMDEEMNKVLVDDCRAIRPSYSVAVNGDFSLSRISIELAFKLALAKLDAEGKRND